MIALYNIMLITGIIVGFPFIFPMVLASKKRRITVLPRLGLQPRLWEVIKNKSHVSGEKPIWIHALSVGEALSAIPLAKEMKQRFSDRPIYFSVSTQTGFEVACEQLKETTDAIFFFPYDFLFSVRHITEKIDPAIVLIVESDIWPNFVLEMHNRNVPVILANARLSQRSFLGYKRLAFFTRHIFSSFSNICTQTIKDADRFKHLGVPSNRVVITGNFKFDQILDPMQEESVKQFEESMKILSSRKVLLAGSTHKGEEWIILNAWVRLKKEFKDLLLIIAPRNPKRTGSVCRMCESVGSSPIQMSALDRSEPGKSHDVIVIDAIGYLKQFYSLVDIAFVGGSLVNEGGHNPLEPAAFAKPILYGPNMSDFEQISQMLETAGGAVTVLNAEDIYRQVAILLNDPGKAEIMGEAALNVLLENKGALEKTLAVVENHL